MSAEAAKKENEAQGEIDAVAEKIAEAIGPIKGGRHFGVVMSALTEVIAASVAQCCPTPENARNVIGLHIKSLGPLYEANAAAVRGERIQ